MIRGRTLWMEPWRMNGCLLGKTNLPVFPQNHWSKRGSLLKKGSPIPWYLHQGTGLEKLGKWSLSRLVEQDDETPTLQHLGLFFFFKHNQHHRTITHLFTMCLDTPPSLYTWSQLLYGTTFTRQSQSPAKLWGDLQAPCRSESLPHWEVQPWSNTNSPGNGKPPSSC